MELPLLAHPDMSEQENSLPSRNTYDELSKTAFIPLAQRKRTLRGGTPAAQPVRRVLTQPRSPVLMTRTRVATTPTPHDTRVLKDVSQQTGYKANKIDRRVFESSGDLGVPKVSKLPLTVPKSPSFTKRRHAPLRPAVMPSNVNSSSTNKPNAARSTRIVQQGLISSAESARRLSQESLKRSVVRPGSTLSSQRAYPMTTPKVTKTAAVRPAVTVPRPFQLATGARADKYQEQFRHKLDGWKRIEKENQFKALPLPTYPDKFVPKKSTKPLTHSVALHLRTDQRAHEREVYEKERQRKEKILQDMLAEKAREDELREQQDVKEMRQRLVPHPTPIRDYPRIEIHKSTRQLTVPKSPVIGEKRKRQMTLDRELSRSAEEDRPLNIEEDPHRQRQDRVRAEIEEQRTKDAQEQQQQQQQQQQNHMQHQNKRPRVSVGTPVDPTIFVNMGRKSWLEFNDL